MHEFNTTGLQFPLKYSDTPKFETLNPTISVNVLVFENNEVFPFYASKHRDRKHHVNLLMITKASSTTCSSETCPLSCMVALNIMATCTCALTASVASRKRDYLQLTSRIVPSTPSRR